MNSGASTCLTAIFVIGTVYLFLYFIIVSLRPYNAKYNYPINTDVSGNDNKSIIKISGTVKDEDKKETTKKFGKQYEREENPLGDSDEKED